MRCVCVTRYGICLSERYAAAVTYLLAVDSDMVQSLP